MAAETKGYQIGTADKWKQIGPAGGCQAFTVSVTGPGTVLVHVASVGTPPADASADGHLIGRGLAGTNPEISGGGLPAATGVWVKAQPDRQGGKVTVMTTTW